MNSLIRMGGEGCMNSEAELSPIEFDIYCPLMDINECKSPHRVNYIKESCEGRLRTSLCKYHGECEHKPVCKINAKPDYIYKGVGVKRYGNKWILFDSTGKELKRNVQNLKKAYEYIDVFREMQGVYDSLDK